MKTKEAKESRSPHYETKFPTGTIDQDGYIDITPYQQEGDPCYGGNTGETEYDEYMEGEQSYLIRTKIHR